MSRRLFKVTIRAREDHYVVAADAGTAYQIVRHDLDTKDRWPTDSRALKTVELIAEQVDYPECGVRLHFQS
jgi:hypothetical protein